MGGYLYTTEVATGQSLNLRERHVDNEPHQKERRQFRPNMAGMKVVIL